MAISSTFAWSDCDLSTTPLDLQGTSISRVVIYDQRETILLKKEKPSWLGYAHSAGGPNWNITTISTKPVVEEIAKVFRKQTGLVHSAEGFVGIPTQENIKAYILENRVKNLLAIHVHDLNVDKIFDARLTYSISFESYDSSGNRHDSILVNEKRIINHADFETTLPKVLGIVISNGSHSVMEPAKPKEAQSGLIDSIAPIDNGKINIAEYKGGWRTFLKTTIIVGYVTAAVSLCLCTMLVLSK